MKVLYAIQGTGNGHMTRAQEIIPHLQKRCMVDLLVSGTQSDIHLRYPVKYKLQGLSFAFSKNGGIDFWKTYNEADFFSFQKQVRMLPVEEYDLIINDFEPISAWAARYKNVPCVSLSHQASLLSDRVPKPSKKNIIGSAIIKHYAPANQYFGFHFSKYDKNIFTPIIKREIVTSKPKNNGHYTVYLPSFSSEKLIKVFSQFDTTKWHIFSKDAIKSKKYDNIKIFPISEERFIRSMVTSSGVVCAAGFETPSEALFLGKKLLVIPQKNQIEQYYNATSLKELGVETIKNLKPKNVEKLGNWLINGKPIKIDYADNTERVIDKVFEHYLTVSTKPTITNTVTSKAKKLVSLMLDLKT